ncbi:hypothetical protein [Streptomyces sp. NPDC090026]|uniref:hypothetical protein n=1 Tax=Streptomyces sp. NPDC090026 TaxID=3365923 RepID=UPI00380AC45E
MRRERRSSGGRFATAAFGTAAAAVLLGGCGTGGGPGEDDWAELVAMAQPRLTDVEIAAEAAADGNGRRLTGTAVVAEDLYVELDSATGSEACGSGVSATAFDAVRGPMGGGGQRVLRRGPAAGTPAEFAVEIVPKKAAVGDTDSDGDAFGAEDVTGGGWALSAVGGGYRVDGVADTYTGHPASFYGGAEAVERAVFVGTPEFEELCERMRRALPAG